MRQDPLTLPCLTTCPRKESGWRFQHWKKQTHSSSETMIPSTPEPREGYSMFEGVGGKEKKIQLGREESTLPREHYVVLFHETACSFVDLSL